jgi:acyl-CoA reductase-like NAD-dependent aldehyde dehydrogenase
VLERDAHVCERAWQVCPALAMGNTVVLKPATYTRLSALLFAEICAEAGLPPGVFNVMCTCSLFADLRSRRCCWARV